MPHTRLIDVCDREADVYELFDEQRQSGRVHLLVRGKHDRVIETAAAGAPAQAEPNPSVEDSPAGRSKLFAAASRAPVVSRVGVAVGRRSARPKRAKQKARPGRPARLAELTVRALTVRLMPSSQHAGQAPIEVQVVHACEDHPPPGYEAVQWLLLTTLPVATAEQAEQCLRWYCLRWRIEDWHRVLKSGCRVEKLQHDTAEGLRRALAVKLVIGWRIMLMTLLGREQPQLPAEVLFSDVELRVLRLFARAKDLPPPTDLGNAVRLTAKLGGYIGRKSDPPPGHQLLWQGFTALHIMACYDELLTENAKKDERRLE
jgi:hypothetical protein